MFEQPFTVYSGKNVYLDHNATAPLAKSIGEKLSEWSQFWGNPSSIHWSGREPKARLRQARQQVAQLLAAQPLEVIFTSGGSESNNMALKSAWYKREKSRNKLIISSVEHPSVRQTARFLESLGAEVVEVPVSKSGKFDMDFYRRALCEKTFLVSVMAANNETGNLFPIQRIAKYAQKMGALAHSDGVQTLGKMPIDLNHWGVDMASFSGHKFYALKGCGVLFVKTGTAVESLLHGGGQERRRRAGTENLLAILSLAHMAQWGENLLSKSESLCELRNELESRILSEIDGVEVTGSESPRLSNTSNLIISGVDGESLLMNLDLKGYSVSTGAACSSGSSEPSPTLLAMGLTREEAQSSLRLGLGYTTTKEEVDQFVEVLKQVVQRLRKIKLNSSSLSSQELS